MKFTPVLCDVLKGVAFGSSKAMRAFRADLVTIQKSSEGYSAARARVLDVLDCTEAEFHTTRARLVHMLVTRHPILKGAKWNKKEQTYVDCVYERIENVYPAMVETIAYKYKDAA